MKKRWVLAALLALICWIGWYARPVDIYTLMPEVEPTYLSLLLLDTDDLADIKEYRFDLQPGDPQYQETLETIEALRFRRAPLSSLWHALGDLGGQVYYGRYHGHLGISDGVHYLELEYLDNWEYTTIIQGGKGPVSHTVALQGGEAATQALTDYLLTVAELQP